MKKTTFLVLSALLFLLLGCRTESLNYEADVSHLSSENDSTGLYKMKDVPRFKNFLKKSLSDSNLKSKNGLISSEDDRLVDVINKNGKISYSTLIKKEDGIFQILVYTIGDKESSFIAEYTPEKAVPYFELEKFTGMVHYKTLDNEVLGTEKFVNGTPAKDIMGKSICGVVTTPISCIEGLHFGNQPCAWAGTSGAAYYDTQIIKCSNSYQNTIYNDGGAYGSSGGGSNPAYYLAAPEALNYMLSQIGMPALNSEQFSYVKSNVPIAERLRTYFFTNQSVNGSNFLYWGIDFLRQNPNVAWEQFQNWFLEEPMNSTLQNELIADWADPNTVKPTSKFKNNTKLNSIYNNIKTASNFKQYLQNFEPTFSVSHLLFDVGIVTNPTAIAQTREPQNYWTKIIFNKDWDYPNTPKAVIAYAFMHEMIHAEIFRKLLSLASTPQGNINWNELTSLLNDHNYPGLFDYYTRYTTSDNDIDHHMMGAHYINIIVNFLKQVYGNTYSDIEYKTIAWSGLRGSKAWNLLPKTERDLYIKTWNDNYWLWEK